MSEQAGHSTPRRPRRPFRAVGRFLDAVDPLLYVLGVLAAAVLAGGLMVSVLTGHHLSVI